jgi:hypothetical protein
MDNPDLGKSSNPNPSKPLSLGKDFDKPIQLDDVDLGNKNVSHSPLDLGGSRPLEVQKTQKPQPKPVPTPVAGTTTQVLSTGRITSVKTFFAKLHVGAMEFLDEQVSEWLKKNPSIHIKQIQTAVGEIQGKKTEPNLIITIWY